MCTGSVRARPHLDLARVKVRTCGVSAPLILWLLMVRWGVAAWAFHPAQNAHLVKISPDAPMVALSLNASALYFGMAVGSSLGGVTLSFRTAGDLGWGGGICATIALGLLLIFSRIGKQRIEK